jgi:reverse gyrase
MESAGKCGAEVLVCKQKTNGSIVWKCFGYKVSDELQNPIFCRECFKSVTKGLSTTNLFHHLQQHNVLQNACSDPKS